jgi:methionine-rich copper-binding protein CopC
MKLGGAVGLIAASFLLLGAGYLHLELVDSRPKEDEVVTEPPVEIWLRFSQPPDVEQSGISVRGPGGAVGLDEVTLADSLSLAAKILDSLESGEYTVSWRAAPHDDHAVRGRYNFTVESSRGPR